MSTARVPAAGRPRWYQTLYWRIGLGFLGLVVAIFGLQSVMFAYVVASARAALPGRSVNSLAALVATDIASSLDAEPDLDLGGHLADQYGSILFPVFVVMRDGRVAGSSVQQLPESFLHVAQAALGEREVPAPRETADGPDRPIVMAPIQIESTLVGMVLILPRPPVGSIMWDVGRFLSIPGVLLLLMATAAAAGAIVGPALRRLRALELATDRLGAGDLSARAPERGGDEVARVARAFNRMAGDLAAREEAVRSSDRLRRQMLADVSHELRTPLTTMRGYLETLQMPDVDLDAETRDRYLDTVEQETRRLERIVKDLLDLARYESGAGTLDRRPFAIERVFAPVAQRYDRESSARAIRLQTDVAKGADQVLGDPDRIEQVIDNLVANALRHTPGGGTIELRSVGEKDTIYVSVVDSGGGIPPEHLPFIFDRFYKANPSRGYESGGSGLGLSIAKAIMERHGGTIEVSSAPGRTAFTVALPNPSDPG